MNSSGTEGSNRDEAAEATDVEAVLALLPRIGQRLHAAMADHAQVWGLTPAQAKVLLQVGLCGPMPVGEIAGALGVSMPAASEIVDRLVEAGFVRRDDDPADRRRVIVAPSDAARRFATELKAVRAGRVRRALAALAPHERPALVRGLEALVAAFADGSGCTRSSEPATAPDAAFGESAAGGSNTALAFPGRDHA